MNVTFDWNEWFFILTTAMIICLFLPIRKYFPSSHGYHYLGMQYWICSND